MTVELVVPTAYVVTMEKYGYEYSRRYRVLAQSPEQAMAIAQAKHRGWIPVDVQAA